METVTPSEQIDYETDKELLNCYRFVDEFIAETVDRREKAYRSGQLPIRSLAAM